MVNLSGVPPLGPTAERVYDGVTWDWRAADFMPVYSQLDTRALGGKISMAYSDTIKFVVGDTLPSLEFTLKDSNTAAAGKTLDTENSDTWAAIDLSGGSVKLRTESGQTTLIQTITGTLADASNGKVTCAIPSGTWTTAGTFEGELEYTTSGGGIHTVQDLIKFKVRDDFD